MIEKEIKYSNKNNDDITKENITENKPNQFQIPNDSYNKLVTGGSGSEKRNEIPNLINRESDIDKIYQHVKRFI